jgi:DNA-binding transcriptional LysR family regulator
VLPGHGVDGVGLHLVYLSRRQLPRAVSAFIEHVAQRAASLPTGSARKAPRRRNAETRA